MKKPLNRRAIKRSLLSSFSRLIGVGLGAGAGSLIYKLIGGGISGWGIAILLSIASFALMTFAEYQREVDLLQ